jgi:hypothetical protein
VAKKRKEFAALKSDLNFFERIHIPLRIESYDRRFDLYSSDYSLAADFKIMKRNRIVDHGSSGYEGGYLTECDERYPQFFFTLPRGDDRITVLIQHNGFENDKRIVVASRHVTRGSGNYSRKSGIVEQDIDTGKVMDFFRKHGVKQSLLDRLGERIEEL